MTPQEKLSRRIARGMALMGMEIELELPRHRYVSGVSIAHTWLALRPRSHEAERPARPLGHRKAARDARGRR